MADVKLNLEGFAVLKYRLAALPDRIETNIVKAALRAAANRIKAAAKANIGSGGSFEGQAMPQKLSGDLSGSVRVVARRRPPLMPEIDVVAGVLRGPGYYAAMVERGHLIGRQGLGGGAKRTRERERRMASGAAQTRPHPFLKAAATAHAQEAVDAMIEKMASRLQELIDQ